MTNEGDQGSSAQPVTRPQSEEAEPEPGPSPVWQGFFSGAGPREPGKWERVWGEQRDLPAPLRTLGLACAAGAVGAWLVRFGVSGVGWLITGVAVFAAVLASSRVRPTVAQWTLIVGTLALLAISSLRAAGWLAWLTVLLSCGLVSLVFAGGRTWSGVLAGLTIIFTAPARVWSWSRGGVAEAKSLRGLHVNPVRVAAVVGVTVGTAFVFGLLFASADTRYADLLDRLLPQPDVGGLFGAFVRWALVGFGTLAASYLAYHRPKLDELAPGPGKPVAVWEWALPLAVLDALFASFVFVQLPDLFVSESLILDPATTLTYASVVHEGFWQLLAVSLLTLAVVAVAARKAPRSSDRERLFLRVLLGFLCALSLVIVASAVRRMMLYQNAYGFTVYRVMVMSFELWLGVVFLLLLAAGVRLSGRWLPTAVVSSGVVGMLVFGLWNPEGFVAERSVARYAQTGRIDVPYLASLSADSAPYLDKLPEPVRSCALAGLDAGLRKLGEQSWYEYNRSREKARRILKEHPIGECPKPESPEPEDSDVGRVPQEGPQERAPAPEQPASPSAAPSGQLPPPVPPQGQVPALPPGQLPPPVPPTGQVLPVPPGQVPPAVAPPR